MSWPHSYPPVLKVEYESRAIGPNTVEVIVTGGKNIPFHCERQLGVEKCVPEVENVEPEPIKKRKKPEGVYLLKMRGRDSVYKVGITNDLRDRTLNILAEAGIKFEVVKYVRTPQAPAVEKQALALGETVLFNEPFNGSTEFRKYNKGELKKVMGLFKRPNNA